MIPPSVIVSCYSITYGEGKDRRGIRMVIDENTREKGRTWVLFHLPLLTLVVFQQVHEVSTRVDSSGY